MEWLTRDMVIVAVAMLASAYIGSIIGAKLVVVKAQRLLKRMIEARAIATGNTEWKKKPSEEDEDTNG